jgi:hypothetical protein
MTLCLSQEEFIPEKTAGGVSTDLSSQVPACTLLPHLVCIPWPFPWVRRIFESSFTSPLFHIIEEKL